MLATELFLSTLIVIFGSVIQVISGVGGGFIMTPLLAMIDVGLLPGPFIFAALWLQGLMAFQERSHINYQHVWYTVAGTMPGAVLGSLVVASVDQGQMGLLFGSVILLAVLLASLGWSPPLNKKTSTVAGVAAGVMTAISAIGAPAIAILYQHQSGPRLRATLALIYFLSTCTILVVLTVFGRFGVAEAAYGLQLVPGFLLGYLLALPFRRRMSDGWIRYAVLGVSALAAVTLILQTI